MKKEIEITDNLHEEKIHIPLGLGKTATCSVVTNICIHKKFKPYSKVLVRGRTKEGEVWVPMVYSMFDKSSGTHVITSGACIKDEDIKPYNDVHEED